MSKAAVVGALAAAAALGAAWFFLRGRASAGVPTPLGDEEEGEPTARVSDTQRTFLGASTRFVVDVVNPSRVDRSMTLGIDAIPGGIEIQVDRFVDSKRITMPARSSQKVLFEHADPSFAPILTWQVTLTLDGRVVARQ